jgi:6-phosphogluconolactonase (cycloisomerase 2 family)
VLLCENYFLPVILIFIFSSERKIINANKYLHRFLFKKNLYTCMFYDIVFLIMSNNSYSKEGEINMGRFKKLFCEIFCACLVIIFNSLPSHAGYLYALNDDGAGNSIYGFNVNETSGALTPLAGFPFATGGTGDGFGYSERMLFDSLNARLYVINSSGSVSAYFVNGATGALTALPFNPISLPAGNWGCLAVHPNGSPLVVGDANGQAASFNITSSSATAAAGSPYSTGTARPYSCAFSKDGNYFYTGGVAVDNFAGFSVNASTGVLTSLSGSPFSSGSTSPPLGYATDNQGRLFVANYFAGEVRAFTTSSGVPSPATGNPFSSGLSQAWHGVLHPSGYYMVADISANRVGVYQIAGTGAGTTLSAVTGSPFLAGGVNTGILTLNQAGIFLFAANRNSRNITTFNINPSTGILSGATTQPSDTLGTSGVINGIAYAPEQFATTVPTLNEWGMIAFMLFAGLGATYYLRKKGYRVK